MNMLNNFNTSSPKYKQVYMSFISERVNCAHVDKHSVILCIYFVKCLFIMNLSFNLKLDILGFSSNKLNRFIDEKIYRRVIK